MATRRKAITLQAHVPAKARPPTGIGEWRRFARKNMHNQ